MRSDQETRDSEPRGKHGHAATTSAARERLPVLLRILLLSLVCGAAVSLSSVGSVADAAPSYRDQINTLEAQADELQAQIADLDQQLEIATEAYNQLVVSLNELNVTMTELRQQQDAAEVDYQYRLRLFENRLCDLYKAGGRDEFLEMILEAGDLGDFLSRARLASELADQDRRLMEGFTRSADRLEAIITDIDETKSQELVVRRKMKQEKSRVETALASRQATLADIDAQIAAAIEAERQRQAEEQERLRQAFANMLNGGQIYYGTLPQNETKVLNQFLETAAAYIGVTYVWGGERPSTGLDCSGYTRYVYRQHGVTLPHYSGYQAVLGLPVELADIRPGDLVAFGFPVHHVGIYIGNDLFLHAAGTGWDVRIGRLSERDNLAAIRRFNIKPRYGAPDFN